MEENFGADVTQIKTERGEMRKRGLEWVRKRKRRLEEREKEREGKIGNRE